MSFGQGDQGTIKYLSEWDLDWKNKEETKDMKVNTINLAVEKVYNYEYYSTDTRNFVLGFNHLWDNMKNTLPLYYALYLNQFYLSNKSLIAKTIFDVMGISQ